MAFNARFYNNLLYKAKDISSTTYFADGAGEALDYCPDTYAQGTLSASTCRLDIDADATGNTMENITWAAVWIRNSNASFGASAALQVKSDDNTGFTTATNQGSSINLNLLTNEQHLLLVTFSTTQERYWRFEFSNMSVAPQVSMVMLGYYWDITRSWDIGGPPHGTTSRHNVRYFNRVDELPDGRWVVQNMRSRGAQQKAMGWSLLDKTNYEALATVHIYARGRYVPFVLATDNDTAMSDHFLCRFTTDEPIVTEPAFELYNILIPMQEVPHFNGREVY